MNAILTTMKTKSPFILKLIFLFSMLITSCSTMELPVLYDFNRIPDRIWVGEEFWTVPLEDWRINDGRVECRSRIQSASLSLLSSVLSDNKHPFRISVEMGLISRGENTGSAGLTIGSMASEEKDIRAAIYFGTGLNMGVSTEGYAFLGVHTKALPEQFDFSRFRIQVAGELSGDNYLITMHVSDSIKNQLVEISLKPEGKVEGIIQMVNNFRGSKSKINGPQFWFDNLQISGSKFISKPENRFGPVLWTMYTLSNNILKMTAQLPPVSISENSEASIQVREGKEWQTLQKERMYPDARTVTWKLENWDSASDKEYRVLFDYINSRGNPQQAEYAGKISKDPVDRDLRFGALTCQYHYGFPYSPLVKNLALSNPDILYFSGDQIYEQNGGYPINREPEDLAILSYLGKWYMFGWAFGDLMRNVPTICTPDDHDVFHGNVWGDGGVPKSVAGDDLAGFMQSVNMVNVVNRTQCAHLPDPYDPSPMKRGISVWYTSLNYGRISFAIVTDRYFKSGPEIVSTWEGRKDHLQAPSKDIRALDRPELELLGKRQEDFLEYWVRDWKEADMKVLLSQTLFANVATHHGRWDYYLYGDLDSNGWPKAARDRALRILRKAFALQIAGDQHVPSLVQYGIDDFRDAGWCYVTPAIAVGYSRWFRPDELAIPVINRPAHKLPDTGEYTDAFGNMNYVYAIGNPDNFKQVPDRYELAQVKSSGFGMVIFDKIGRKMTMESWRFLADMENPGPDDQHPGWPLTISQIDNYGKKPAAWLPTLSIKGPANPVIEVIDNKNNETIYIVRIKGNEFKPWVFEKGLYNIRIGYPEKDNWKWIKDINTENTAADKEMIVSFDSR